MLVAELAACRGCPLYANYSHVVPGEGYPKAKYMVVGEAPGAEEAATGRPFVGPSGKMLNLLIRVAMLHREQLWVTNLVKHRPSKNRPPKAAEVKACAVWLEEELRQVSPQVVLAVGEKATAWFLKKMPGGLTREHGRPREVEVSGWSGLVVPMYHPAATFRRPDLWQLMVTDWERLLERLEEVKRKEEVKYELWGEARVTEFIQAYHPLAEEDRT